MTKDTPDEGLDAKWIGDDTILPEGETVQILASDPEDPSVPARRACWVRWWPERRDYPSYRSCDLSDLDIDDASLDALDASVIGSDTCLLDGRAELIERLTEIANHDWRFSFLAHTSDTAREAASYLADLGTRQEPVAWQHLQFPDIFVTEDELERRSPEFYRPVYASPAPLPVEPEAKALEIVAKALAEPYNHSNWRVFLPDAQRALNALASHPKAGDRQP